MCAGKMDKFGTEEETYTHESRCGVEIEKAENEQDLILTNGGVKLSDSIWLQLWFGLIKHDQIKHH